MKKIGIAVFALMFVGVAYVGAQEIEIDFDGEIAVQNGQNMEKFSMPEVFSDIEYDIPVPSIEVNYEINAQLLYEGVEYAGFNYFESMGQASKKILMSYYASQDKIKKIVSKYYADKGDNKLAKKVLDKDIRIMADDFTVHIIKSGNDVKINNVKLAIAIGKIVKSKSQQKIAGFVAGATFVAGCMLNDDCWDVVGDGVSAVSEWIHS